MVQQRNDFHSDEKLNGQPAYRAAYTLLELMLALGLLGALLAVAWSLMGTYRDAEQKGWQLSMRSQTVRAVHGWLQTDADHLIDASNFDGSTNPLLGSSQASNSLLPRQFSDSRRVVFAGNGMGFTATVQPSLEPLTFLERLLSDEAPLADDVSIRSRDTATAMAVNGPWSDAPLRLEYRLMPMADATENALRPGSFMPRGADDSLAGSLDGERRYQLTRTTRQTVGMPSVSNAVLTGSATIAPADRILTSQDLYRQTEEETGQPQAPIVESAVVQGLVNAQFRYFDGQRWVDQWDAANRSLPLAIALSFDMPRRFEFTLTAAPLAAEESSVEEFPTQLPATSVEQLSFAEATLSSEPIAEIDTGGNLRLVENPAHQVHVVVRTPSIDSNRQLTAESNATTLRLSPGGVR